MKTSTAALLFLACLFFSFVTNEPEANEVIIWNEYRPLTWDDFKGKRAEDAAGDAGTVVQIKAKPYIVKNEVKYDVSAVFVKNKSWADAHTKELLAHEQLHFDIAELYARKIRQEIARLSAAGEDDVKVFNRAIQKLLHESNEVDVQYDLETLHGAMQNKQAEWTKNVKSQLKALAEFKKHRTVISADTK
ncbi:MAG TPA: DUF922 domain-containing protein [Chryseosolibacter sp.]